MGTSDPRTTWIIERLDGDPYGPDRHPVNASMRRSLLRPRLVPPAAQPLGAPARRIIFACPDNAGRSEMAAAYFNHLADPRLARAIAASIQPAGPSPPTVLEAMLEVCIDLPQLPPRKLTGPLATTAHHLVTMGCEEDFAFFPGVKVEDWPVGDPKGLPAARVREIRDDVRRRVEAMVASSGWTRSEPVASDVLG